MAFSVFSAHPNELTYFNQLAGGSLGGRRILSDSNLDWGQGAKYLARLQRERPEFRDLTLFYFGDIDPAVFGYEGERYVFRATRDPEKLPTQLSVQTKYLAVSATLQWGPIGPNGYFAVLDTVEPVAYTSDTSIAIYRTDDLARALAKNDARKP